MAKAPLYQVRIYALEIKSNRKLAAQQWAVLMIFLFYALICVRENHAQRCASARMVNCGTISSNFVWIELSVLNVLQIKLWKSPAARLKTATKMFHNLVECPCLEVHMNTAKFSYICRILSRSMRVPGRTQMEWKYVC